MAPDTFSPSLLALPGFAALVAIGSFDEFFVVGELDDLVEDSIELRLVRIADLTLVGQFDDRLAGDLTELRLVQVRPHESHRFDVVSSAYTTDDGGLFLCRASFLHRLLHPLQPLLIAALIANRTDLDVCLKRLATL